MTPLQPQPHLRVNTSAIDRLLLLPEVFTGGDVGTLFGWKSTICSSYLANWKKAGLIKSLGGRSDVHMNLVRNRQVNPEAALRRAFPHSVKVGVDLLREAGWTTQIPSKIEIAVPQTNSLYALDDFSLTTRTDKWFERVAEGVDRVRDGVDRLRPSWALADMIARAQDGRVRHAWLLDPEDIDLESARADPDCAVALKAFELEMDCLEDDRYEDIYSELTQTDRKRRQRER